MPYSVILSPQAERDLAAMTGALREHILESLKMLAENPVASSRSSHFPYPPDCQLFRPQPFLDEDGRHEFMVLFRYGQDEVSVQVIGVGHYILE